MPTTIDTLVVELALDARNLNEQTRRALEQFKRTGEEAKKYAGETEAHGKKLLEFFTDLKRVAIGMTTLFLGGMGVKEFTGFMMNLDAATGRVAKTMDISAAELSTWQGAAERMGNTGEGITGTLQGLSSELNTFRLTGQTGLLGPLTQLGISLYNTNGQLKTSTELFKDITKAVEGMNPAQARAMLTLLGFDQGAVNMAIEGQKKLADALQKSREAGVPTAEDVKRMQEQQAAIATMERSVQGLGRSLLAMASPAITSTIEVLTRMFIGLRTGKTGLEGITPGPSSPFGENVPGVGFVPSDAGPSGLGFPAGGRLIGNVRGMNPDFVRRLRAMAAHFGDIRLNSGFRTAEEQEALRRHNPSGFPVAQGTSAHEHGLAGDIRGATPEIDRMIHEHAGDFGIRFPVKNDPVHAVPIGPPLPLGAGAAAPQHTSLNSHSTDRSTKIDIAEFNINANNARDVQRVVEDIPTTVRRSASIASYGSGLA